MASTAIKTEEEKQEYFDNAETLNKKVEQLAEMILKSQSPIAFTGAGISTACGIPDYRSGYNTCLPTGPGCWETAANKKKYEQLCKEGKAKPVKIDFKESIQRAKPSLTHMSLVELIDKGILKGIVSQNIDGLHRKSGIHPDKLADLHGNTNLELCTKCGAEYMRDFRVRTAKNAKEHKTGRTCDNPSCKGDLIDTIINFGENLNREVQDKGQDMCLTSDLMICMGSSLRVSPANQMAMFPLMYNDGSLVIINLQKTIMDDYAKLVIYGKVDDVMKLLMEKLELKIPQFSVKRRVAVQLQNDSKLSIRGIDSNNAPFQLFTKVEVSTGTSQEVPASKHPATVQSQGTAKNRAKSVVPVKNKLSIGNTVSGKTITMRSQPYKADMKNILLKTSNSNVNIKLSFQGHYQEPDLTLKLNVDQIKQEQEQIYFMEFNPYTKKWQQVVQLDKRTDEVIQRINYK